VTRSPINYQAGAVTRFSGVIAAIGVAIIVLLFAPLLHYMPRAALAGLLLITAARLIDIKRLSYAIKASRYDAGLVIITALVGVFVDLDTAVLLGVALSILLFVPRAAKLKARELVVAPRAGGSASGCRPIRPIRRRLSMTSRVSCSSAPHPISSSISTSWASGSSVTTSNTSCCGSSGCVTRTPS